MSGIIVKQSRESRRCSVAIGVVARDRLMHCKEQAYSLHMPANTFV